MAATTAPARPFVALLRGINVGGKNVIPMAALRRSFEALGYSAVRTLLASGNVLFSSADGDCRSHEAGIERGLAARHRYDAKVVVRSQRDYERMMRAMPALWGIERGFRYYVMFLRRAIDRPSVLKELDVNDEVEELRYVPGALLWSARLDGLTRSKVSRMIGKPIYQEMTVRNLNTVRRIHGLMKESGD